MGWQGESHRQEFFFSPPIILGNPGLSIRADVFCVFTHQSFIGLASIIHWFVQITSPKKYSPVRNRHCLLQTCLSISLLTDDAFCRGFCVFSGWHSNIILVLPALMKLEGQGKARQWLGPCPRNLFFVVYEGKNKGSCKQGALVHCLFNSSPARLNLADVRSD